MDSSYVAAALVYRQKAILFRRRFSFIISTKEVMFSSALIS